MAEEKQPASLTEGATTGDVEDEIAESKAAKSGDDRKAAAALASLDARDDDANKSGSKGVDQEGLSKAMDKLGKKSASTSTSAAANKPGVVKTEVKKPVKIDQTDVALLVDQLDLTKPKATELLRQYDGDAVKAMRAFITVS